jgi:hypothetical protein
MQSGISGANPEAEQVQIALLRQAGMARRVELAAELTSFYEDCRPEADGNPIRQFMPSYYVARTHKLALPQQG